MKKEEVVVKLTFCLWLNCPLCFIVSVDWSHVSSNHDTRKAPSIGLFQHPEWCVLCFRSEGGTFLYIVVFIQTAVRILWSASRRNNYPCFSSRLAHMVLGILIIYTFIYFAIHKERNVLQKKSGLHMITQIQEDNRRPSEIRRKASPLNGTCTVCRTNNRSV